MEESSDSPDVNVNFISISLIIFFNYFQWLKFLKNKFWHIKYKSFGKKKKYYF